MHPPLIFARLEVIIYDIPNKIRGSTAFRRHVYLPSVSNPSRLQAQPHMVGHFCHTTATSL
jgi:hypothetical protein